MEQYPNPLANSEIERLWIRYSGNSLNSTMENNDFLVKIVTPLLEKLWEPTNIDELYMKNIQMLEISVAKEFNRVLNEASNLYNINPYKNSKLDVLKRIQGSLVMEIIFNQMNVTINEFHNKIIPLYYIYACFYKKSDNIYKNCIINLLVLPPECLFELNFNYDFMNEEFDIGNLFNQFIRNYKNNCVVDRYCAVLLRNMINYLVKIFDTPEEGLKWLNSLPYSDINNKDFRKGLEVQLSLILAGIIFRQNEDFNYINITMLVDAIMSFDSLNEKLFAAFSK